MWERRRGTLGRLGSWAKNGGGRPARLVLPFSSFRFFESKIQINTFKYFASFLKVGVKTKVVPNFIIYNFALSCKSKFLRDFELQVNL